MGGGKNVCLIRESVQKRGYRGCWECRESKNCKTLAPLKRFHGKTIEHYHQMIRSMAWRTGRTSEAGTTRGGKPPRRFYFPDRLNMVTDLKA
jgi:hypothetical protein